MVYMYHSFLILEGAGGEGGGIGMGNTCKPMAVSFQCVTKFTTKKKKKKTSPMEKKCKKAKWLSEVALQIAVRKREAKSKGEKERHSHLNALNGVSFQGFWKSQKLLS